MCTVFKIRFHAFGKGRRLPLQQTKLLPRYTNMALCTPSNTFRVVMFGLENSGKTTIVQKFSKCIKSSVIRIPPNIQHFDWGPLRVTSVDVSPKKKTRMNVFNGSKAVIFVLDASDYNNFDEAKCQFWQVADTRKMRRVPVLVLANKCDCPGALTAKQVEEKFGLLALNRKFKVVQSNARNGDGICEGFGWVKGRLSSPRKSCMEFLSDLLIHLNSTNKEPC